MRNRIVKHVRIRAGDLIPHELNPRRHPERQRRALLDLYEKIGFARSLLAYELADGRLKLIDGHLRKDLTPEAEVDVEILDVSDAEARALLLSIDPLAQLAENDEERLAELRRLTPALSESLTSLWDQIGQAATATKQAIDEARKETPTGVNPPPEQFLILVTCGSEDQQVALLQRFQDEGLDCRALLS